MSTSAHPPEDARLREALSLLAATLESTADGILVVGVEGPITSSTPSFSPCGACPVSWRIPATKDP